VLKDPATGHVDMDIAWQFHRGKKGKRKGKKRFTRARRHGVPNEDLAFIQNVRGRQEKRENIEGEKGSGYRQNIHHRAGMHHHFVFQKRKGGGGERGTKRIFARLAALKLPCDSMFSWARRGILTKKEGKKKKKGKKRASELPQLRDVRSPLSQRQDKKKEGGEAKSGARSRLTLCLQGKRG